MSPIHKGKGGTQKRGPMSKTKTTPKTKNPFDREKEGPNQSGESFSFRVQVQQTSVVGSIPKLHLGIWWNRTYVVGTLPPYYGTTPKPKLNP